MIVILLIALAVILFTTATYIALVVIAQFLVSLRDQVGGVGWFQYRQLLYMHALIALGVSTVWLTFALL